jgi:hypothetical protein
VSLHRHEAEVGVDPAMEASLVHNTVATPAVRIEDVATT